MRNLLIILLVSILGCGWVIKSTNNRTVNIINHQIEQTKFPLETFTYSLFSLLAQQVSKYPEYKKLLNIAVTMEAFSDSISVDFVPENQATAKEFIAQQQANHQKYFKLLDEVIYKTERESLLTGTDFSFDENYFHNDSDYKSLLQNIQHKSLQFSRLSSIMYLLEQARGTCSFCWDSFEMLMPKQVQVHQSSSFPIIYTDNCYRSRRSVTRKIWINDVLIYDMLKGDIYPYEKVKLTYKGEKNHKVKIEFQKHPFAPIIYLEKTFDYNIAVCNNKGSN